MCVLAILSSLLDRLFFSKTTKVPVRAPSLFIGIVSYCDNWGAMVQNLLENADAPKNLRIGVVEYVKSVEDTLEPAIPRDWRSVVRVYTVSSKTATTLRKAQTLCIEQLYGDQPYILFLRACSVIRHWDTVILKNCTHDAVVCTHITDDGAPTFPCIDRRGKISHKPMKSDTERNVRSLLFQHDFAFFPKKVLQDILTTTNALSITAILVAKGIDILVPTYRLAQARRSPVSVPRGKPHKWVDADNIEYAKKCGFVHDDDTPNVYTRLGLTPSAEDDEIISKYGSVLGARLVIQECQHADKDED